MTALKELPKVIFLDVDSLNYSENSYNNAALVAAITEPVCEMGLI